MIDNDTKFKILDEYKNFIQNKGLDIKLINYFIKEFNLDPCDSSTHIRAIEKLKVEQKRFVIPKQIGEKKILANPGESFVLIENNIKYKIERLYENCTEKEAQEISQKRYRIDDEIQYLIDFLNITELYTSRISESNTNKKRERNTRSKKNSFIDLYLKSAYEHKMAANKKIAEFTKISAPTASRLLNEIDILNQLHSGLLDIFDKFSERLRGFEFSENRNKHQIDEAHQKIANIEFNQLNIQGRIQKLEREKKIREHLELSKKGM